MVAHCDAKTRTVGDPHDWQMVLLDTRRNRYLFCISGDDFSLAGNHLCLCYGRGLEPLLPKKDHSSIIGLGSKLDELMGKG